MPTFFLQSNEVMYLYPTHVALEKHQFPLQVPLGTVIGSLVRLPGVLWAMSLAFFLQPSLSSDLSCPCKHSLPLRTT